MTSANIKKTAMGHTGLPGKKWAWSNAKMMVNIAGPYIQINDRLNERNASFRNLIMVI